MTGVKPDLTGLSELLHYTLPRLLHVSYSVRLYNHFHIDLPILQGLEAHPRRAPASAEAARLHREAHNKVPFIEKRSAVFALA